MAYNGKTNWQLDDIVAPEDLNRIEQGIKDADTNKLDKTGNATSATKLQNKRTITVSGAVTATPAQFDGTENISIPVSKLDATKLEGEAAVDTTGNAGSATKLKNKRTIAISGAVTGNATEFDGSGDISIEATALDPTKLSQAVPVAKGGTGATTVDGAVANLKIAVTANTNIYVATTGNDTTGDGTSGAPYRSINKALSGIPKNLGGKTVTINIGGGNYSGTLAIENFTAGTIVLKGSDGGSLVYISSMKVQNSTVLVSDLNINLSSGLELTTNAFLYDTRSTFTVNGGPVDAIIVRYGSKLEVASLTVNNATGSALLVQYNSTASVQTLAGSGNSIGITVLRGVAHIQTNTLTATVASGVIAGEIYK